MIAHSPAGAPGRASPSPRPSPAKGEGPNTKKPGRSQVLVGGTPIRPLLARSSATAATAANARSLDQPAGGRAHPSAAAISRMCSDCPAAAHSASMARASSAIAGLGTPGTHNVTWTGATGARLIRAPPPGLAPGRRSSPSPGPGAPCPAVGGPSPADWPCRSPPACARYRRRSG